MNKVLYSHQSDEWETPQNLFDELNEEFNFTVDLCANSDNYKCTKYYSKDNNGLLADLSNEIVFCNPPYSQLSSWIKKCAESMTTCVMLIPARTDTKAFHEYIYKKAEIRFIKGRLKFSGSKNSAPFPSMIVIFRGKEDGKE